ncbi:MAG: hypothetical protein QOC79_2269, partial [Actinomycetota bacterium]|nr:hypothetical protein [Actinomycetota bacterium]
GPDGLWHVKELDAHAWPEVWLGQKVGWYRFEPTPGRTDPVTGLGGSAAADSAGSTTTTPTTAARTTTPTTASLTPNSSPSQIQVQPPATPPGSRTGAHVLTALAATLAIAAVAFGMLLAALAFGAWRRTRRRRHDPDDRRRVLGAWTEALEQLSAAGIERKPSTTSLEFALRQAPALGAGAAGPPLMVLARLHTAALYSRDAPSSDEADEAWAGVDAIAGALRASVPRARRLRIRWWSGLRRPARHREDAQP